MRFLPHEHAAVTEALAAQGFDVRTVLFVKRRGRLHVQVPGRTDTFVLFRKRTTELDAKGQWLDRIDYFLGNAKTDGTGIGWDDVLAAFRSWLGRSDAQTQQRSTA